MFEEEVIGTIENRRPFKTDASVDEEDYGSTRRRGDPGFPTSIVHFPVASGFSVMVHANHFAPYIDFAVDVAVDGDCLGLCEQVRVVMFTDLKWKLLLVTDACHLAGSGLVDHFCGL